MKLLNKYLSVLLLLTFGWVIIPTHTLHDLFADHEDTEHGYCAKYHSHLGIHVEKKHTHCKILDTHTPLYEKPSIVLFEKKMEGLSGEISTLYVFSYFNKTFSLHSNRGPPTLV